MGLSPDVFISEEQIARRISELGSQITVDYQNKNLVVCCVLRGAFIFAADLIRQVQAPLSLEYVQVSSYGGGTTSSGECELLLDLTHSVEGKDILLVEDIVDTGNTITYLQELLKSRKPNSIKVASLLYKPARTIKHVDIDYLGFEIEDKFVVGYGLDYDGRYRELPYIGQMNVDN